MKSASDGRDCITLESMTTFALGALPTGEADSLVIHLAECAECEREFSALQPLAASLPAWPLDIVPPSRSLWSRLATRLPKAVDTVSATDSDTHGLPWEEVTPGIFCMILSTDSERDRVSMLVRLNPGIDYPAHEHADLEELHLLDGELWINDRKLVAGDYNRAEAGSADRRVWSETGCTCVLITSLRDRLTPTPAP